MTNPDPDTLINHQHALVPQVGDYWHEMLKPVCVVVDVSEFTVVVCVTTKPSGDDRWWTWDLGKLKVIPRKVFINRYRYGRVGNPRFKSTEDFTNIKNKFWCDVSPKAHEWVYESYCEIYSNED